MNILVMLASRAGAGMLLLLAVVTSRTAADGNCTAHPLANVSMAGGDVKPVVKRHADSAAECCEQCSEFPGCKVWTWVETSSNSDYTHVCWFKESTHGRTNFSGHISGITATPVPSPPSKPSCNQGSPWCPPPYPPLPPPDKPPTRVCKTCKKPVFSWEKLPAFFHGCDQDGPNGGLTDATLEVVKKFPLVTLEKWQGDSVVPYMWEEDAWVVAAKQIKAASPSTAVVVWFDSFRIYTANKTLNPDLGSSCTTGHYRSGIFPETHPEMLLKNTSGKPALEPWSRCHIYDFTQPSVQAYWTEMCLNITDSGVIDGCGADASWQVDPTGGTTSPEVAAAWDIGHRTMMRDTTLALGDGLLLGKDPWELGYHVNGVLHEQCTPGNTTINTLRNLTKQAAAVSRAGANFSGPLVYECHGSGKYDEVASFLIGAGPYHFYGFGGWSSGEGHYNSSIMDQKLGVPDGDATYTSDTQVWMRTFAGGAANGGTTVHFDLTTNTGSIQWAI